MNTLNFNMKALIGLSVLLLFTVSLNAQEATHWRGPDADGIFPDKDLLETWPDEGPEMRWSFDGIGKGFSSPVFANNKIYITGTLE